MPRGLVPGLIAIVSLLMLPVAEAATIRKERVAMGSPFVVTAVAPEEATAQVAVDRAYQEIERIEAEISSWRESSQTSEVNRAAGRRPVEVSRELFDLIRRAIRVSELTDGAFDVTFASLSGLWDFKATPPRIPSQEAITKALEKTGYQHIVLDQTRRTVYLDQPGTRIGFGALGKGYAANRAVAVLRDAGATAGVVNAGGDLFAWGLRDDGKPWSVGISDPETPDAVYARLRVQDYAVVTSGDYERYIVVDGKRYSHILDPRTGWPADFLRSVTVLCPDAELADALATSVFVLGLDEGLALVDRLKNTEALLIDASGTPHFSKNLRSMSFEEEEGR